MHPLAVLASGRGSNLQAMIDAGLPVACVISDRPDAGALKRARAAGIPAHFVDPTSTLGRDDYDRALEHRLVDCGAERVVLAGFMRILGPTLVRHWHGKMINVHPSLLPKYRGLHTHRRVLEAGDAEHGASVHFVTEELDGGPLVLQVRMAVRTDDDESTLHRRVQQAEHRVYPVVAGWLAAGRLVLGEDGVELDGRRLAQPFMVTPESDLKCLAA